MITKRIIHCILFILAFGWNSGICQDASIKYHEPLKTGKVEKVPGNTEDYYIFTNESKTARKLFFVSRKSLTLQSTKSFELSNDKNDKVLGLLRSYVCDDKVVFVYGGYVRRGHNYVRFYFYDIKSGRVNRKDVFKSPIKETLSRDDIIFTNSPNRKFSFLAIKEKDYLLLDDKGNIVYTVPGNSIKHYGRFFITNLGDFIMFYDPVESFANRERFRKSPKERDKQGERSLMFQFFDEKTKSMIENDLNFSINNDDDITYSRNSSQNAYSIFRTRNLKGDRGSTDIETSIYTYYPYKDSSSTTSFIFDHSIYPVPHNVYSLFRKEFPTMLPRITEIINSDNEDRILTYMKQYRYYVHSRNAVTLYQHLFDLLMVKIDRNGNILWEKILPHRVVNMNHTIGDNSYISFINDDYLYVLVAESTSNHDRDILNPNARLEYAKLWTIGNNRENIRCYRVNLENGRVNHFILHDAYNPSKARINLVGDMLYRHDNNSFVLLSLINDVPRFSTITLNR